ncbi:hypothetical protein ACP70R_026273 [Stipagrostis hirtigluma subsp. patula]
MFLDASPGDSVIKPASPAHQRSHTVRWAAHWLDRVELAEDSRVYWHIACGGTKHEAGTALLARRPQDKPKILLKIILVAFLQVVQLLPQACCLPLPELSVKQEIMSVWELESLVFRRLI